MVVGRRLSLVGRRSSAVGCRLSVVDCSSRSSLPNARAFTFVVETDRRGAARQGRKPHVREGWEGKRVDTWPSGVGDSII